MYSLLRVYLAEGPDTSVELLILTTHLHRGCGGSREVGGAEELGRITYVGQREKSDKSMYVLGHRASPASSSITKGDTG